MRRCWFLNVISVSILTQSHDISHFEITGVSPLDLSLEDIGTTISLHVTMFYAIPVTIS